MRLAPPPAVALPADGTGVVRVKIARQNYRGSVKLTVTGLPSDVTSKVAWIGPEANEAEITLAATCNLLVTTATVHLEAAGGGNDIHDDASFDLVVGIPERRLGALDVRLAGRGYVPISLGGWPGELVPTTGGRALLLTTTCELARYDVATVSLDAAFGVKGAVSLSVGSACADFSRALDGDLFASALVDGKKRIFRVLETGALDPTYDARIDATSAWAFDARGRMFAMGSDAMLRRYDEAGAPDPTFAPTRAPHAPARVAPLDDGALVIGTEAYAGAFSNAYRVVVSHVGPFGGIDSELVLPRYLGNEWEEEGASWARALPSGDVLLALACYNNDAWTTDGALVRLVRPAVPGAPWRAQKIGGGQQMGTPSFDADGSLFIGGSSSEHNGPGFGTITHFDANEKLVAWGYVGGDHWYPWVASTRLVPVGDGTALVTTGDPRQDVPTAVLARVWIRP